MESKEKMGDGLAAEIPSEARQHGLYINAGADPGHFPWRSGLKTPCYSDAISHISSPKRSLVPETEGGSGHPDPAPQEGTVWARQFFSETSYVPSQLNGTYSMQSATSQNLLALGKLSKYNPPVHIQFRFFLSYPSRPTHPCASHLSCECHVP